MKTVKTNSGLEIEIDEASLNDMEFFDAIADLQRGNTLAASVVVDKLCGKSKKQLYDHCRTPDGRVPIEAVSEEVKQIFEALGEKNS